MALQHRPIVIQPLAGIQPSTQAQRRRTPVHPTAVREPVRFEVVASGVVGAGLRSHRFAVHLKSR